MSCDVVVLFRRFMRGFLFLLIIDTASIREDPVSPFFIQREYCSVVSKESNSTVMEACVSSTPDKDVGIGWVSRETHES